MGRQFVVQVDNRPGELAHLARALASRGINISHVSSAGMGATACVFVMTSDDDETRAVLRGLGHPFIEGETIVAEVVDRPGGLADVTGRLAAAGINILGALTIGRREGYLQIAFSVDDPARARAVLQPAATVQRPAA